MRKALLAVALMLGFSGSASAQYNSGNGHVAIPSTWTKGSIQVTYQGYTPIYYCYCYDGNGTQILAFFEHWTDSSGSYYACYSYGTPSSYYSIANHPEGNVTDEVLDAPSYVHDIPMSPPPTTNICTDSVQTSTVDPTLMAPPFGVSGSLNWNSQSSRVAQTMWTKTAYYEYCVDEAGQVFVAFFTDANATNPYMCQAVQTY